jgi:hypothetical protein
MQASGAQDRGGEVKTSIPCRQMTAKFVCHFSPIISPPLTEVSHVAWRGAPLKMTGGTTKAVHRGSAAYRLRCDGVVSP